jgi:hypothetical protein
VKRSLRKWFAMKPPQIAETPEEREARQRLEFFYDRPASEVTRIAGLFHERVAEQENAGTESRGATA